MKFIINPKTAAQLKNIGQWSDTAMLVSEPVKTINDKFADFIEFHRKRLGVGKKRLANSAGLCERSMRYFLSRSDKLGKPPGLRFETAWNLMVALGLKGSDFDTYLNDR